MSRSVLTLAAVLMFALASTAVLAQSVPYGVWETPGPATEVTASWLGTSGLIITPTAYIGKPLQVQGFYHSIDADPKRQDIYGVQIPFNDYVEASVVHMTGLEPLPSDPGQYRDETAFSAKVRIPISRVLEQKDSPEVAVGVFDLSNNINRTWYLTVSQRFAYGGNGPNAMGLHLGIGDADRGGRLNGIFAGVDFAPSKDLLLQAEYDTQSLNACLRYFMAPWLSLHFGIVDDNFAYGAGLRKTF